MNKPLLILASNSPREQLVPIVYDELRRLAHRYMRGERAGHTLQTTALVNEEKLIYFSTGSSTMYGLKGRGQTEDH